jgi:hypothetical protein
MTIPGQVSKGDDVLSPLKKLLKGINILGKTSDVTGAQVLESDATALTKVWASLVGGAGGLTTIAVPLIGFLGPQPNRFASRPSPSRGLPWWQRS